MHKLFLIFLIYSFCGWLMEVTFKFVSLKKFVNRGFLIGPLCPIYGVAGIFAYCVLSNLSFNIFLLFFASLISFGILEYFASWILECLFHTRWWDYSHKKYNIDGRVCLRNLLFFGIIGCLGVYYMNPFISNLIDQFDVSSLKAISTIIMIVLIIDFIASIKLVSKLSAYLTNAKKDSSEELSGLIKNDLKGYSRYFKRILFAYPNFNITVRKIKDKITSYSKKVRRHKDKKSNE